MPHGSIREEIINSINKGIKNDVFSSYPGQHSGTTVQIVYPALHTQTNSDTNNVENNKVEYLKTTTLYRVAQNKPDYSTFQLSFKKNLHKITPLTLVADGQIRRQKRNVHSNILR